MSENQESKKINLKDFSPKNVLLENDRFMPITVKNTVRFFVTDIFSGILFAPDFVFPVTQPVSGRSRFFRNFGEKKNRCPKSFWPQFLGLDNLNGSREKPMEL